MQYSVGFCWPCRRFVQADVFCTAQQAGHDDARKEFRFRVSGLGFHAVAAANMMWQVIKTVVHFKKGPRNICMWGLHKEWNFSESPWAGTFLQPTTWRFF